MKKFLSFLMLTLLTAGFSAKAADEMYAVWDNSTTTLTLYYDDRCEERGGATSWSSYQGSTTTVVLDVSMKAARPSGLAMFFKGWKKLTEIQHLDYLNTTNVTSIWRMFQGCSSLTSLDLSSFSTEKVTDMEFLFEGCSSLSSIKFSSSFNTENVTTMKCMFYNCSSLTSLDLSSFNTEKVTEMMDMFSGCSSLASLKLSSSFNTENVTDMSAMFYKCNTLTSLDLSSFNTENVTDMPDMFNQCSSLTSLDLSSFNTKKVTNMSAMFYKCNTLTSLDLSSFNTENVTDMHSMFKDCSSLTSLDISAFNISNATNLKEIFRGCSALITIFCDNNWSTSTADSENMFYECSKLKGGNGTTCDGTNNIDNSYAHPDEGETNPGYFTQKPTETYTVFDGDHTLIYYYNRDRAKHKGTGVIAELYEPEKGHNKERFEGYADKVTKAVIDESFKDAKLTSLANMFDGAKSGRELLNMDTIEGLKNIDFSEVKDMYCMFAGCASLKSIDLSKFNTAKVENMQLMFFKCTALTSLDVSGFNTANVTTMETMFNKCSSLTELDLTNFNMDKVTTVVSMFSECSSLKTIYCESNWSAITKSDWLFNGCTSLVGGNGTQCNGTDNILVAYAHPDETGNPGYFTGIASLKARLYAVIQDMNALYTFAVQYVPAATLATYKTGIEGFEAVYNNPAATSAEVKKAVSDAQTALANAVVAIIPAGKTALKATLDGMLQTGDNETCQNIINDAKGEIDALAWDDTKTVAENIAALDTAIKTILDNAGKALTTARTTTGFEIVESQKSKVEGQKTKVESGKVIRNGQLLIIRDGKTYNAVGAEVR